MELTERKKIPGHFDNVWDEWENKQDFTQDIKRRRENRKRFYEGLKKYILSSRNVLEIGCGSGIDTNIMAVENPDIKFFCMDVSGNSLSLTRKVSTKLKNKIYVTRGNVNQLFYKKESFDLIFSQGLVEHFSDPDRMINEQLYVLKNGGILVINVPQRYTGYTLMKHWKMKKGSWKWIGETEYSYSRLKRLGRRYRLHEVEVFGYQYWSSWWEPVFVLRDLYDKFHRRNRWKEKMVFLAMKKIYDQLWNFLENRWGHYFMQDIVIIFQKTR